MLKRIIIFALMLSLQVFAEGAYMGNGNMVSAKSKHNFEVTLDRLKEAISSREIPIFAVFDHYDNADKVGLDLEKTSVVVFGSPKVGTKLMQQNIAIAIELPLRILVWEDKSGVYVGYIKATEIAKKYVGLDDGILERMDNLLGALATQATKK